MFVFVSFISECGWRNSTSRLACKVLSYGGGDEGREGNWCHRRWCSGQGEPEVGGLKKVNEALFSLQHFTSGQISEMHLNLNASADYK